MAASDMFDISELVQKAIAPLEALPAQQKKEYILKHLDTAETSIRKYGSEKRFLGKVDNIRQRVLNTGIIELGLRDFGKSEIITLFQIARDVDVNRYKRNRRIAYSFLIAFYLFLFLSFFFLAPSSTRVRPLITSNPITIIAWAVVSLLFATSYLLLNNLSEIIFKPLNKYKFKFIINEYSIGYILSLLACNIYYGQSISFFEKIFIAPYLYPFIIRTIQGIVTLQFGSLFTSLIGIIIFCLTTINSMLQIRQLIKEIFGKRKDDNQ